jgi:hypothetical protein
MVSFSSDRFDFYRLILLYFLWLSYLLFYSFLDFLSRNPKLQCELTSHLLFRKISTLTCMWRDWRKIFMSARKMAFKLTSTKMQSKSAKINSLRTAFLLLSFPFLIQFFLFIQNEMFLEEGFLPNLSY